MGTVWCVLTGNETSWFKKRQSTYVDRHPGIIEKSGGDNEIWSFGEEDYVILKDLVELRNRLKPYICKYMDITTETGAPIMRPMFFDYYDDEICYTLEDQYMFGEDILFAPITGQGQTKRKVYLPKGQWIDTRTKEEISGEKWIECQAAIDEFIAFVKKGSDIINAF